MLAKLTSKNQITLPKALVSKFPGAEYFAVREVDGEIILKPVSDETLAELVRVLAYPRFRLTAEDRENIIVHYMEHAEAIKQPRTRARLPRCRDPDDEMFIRLAYAAKADAIVTGDEDLLSLAPDSSIQILTPVAFRALP